MISNIFLGEKMFSSFFIKRLNNRAKKDSETIIKKLGELNKKVIVDIGSGGGYFTNLFSKIVGNNGLVYAIDNDQKKLDYIKKNYTNSNIVCIYGDSFESFYTLKDIDIIFSRNSYHHLADPITYFKNLKQLIKDDGKVVIIDYIKEKRKYNFVNLFGHYSDMQVIQEDMKKAGFKLEDSLKISNKSSFQTFSKI